MFKFNKKIKLNKGMTYIELIVVLSIFSVMSGVVLFNYRTFQAKVDIKNLANDIALKIVQAQKEALSGKSQSVSFATAPAYGVSFNTSTDNKSFIYFADLNNDNICEDLDNACASANGEVLDKINITKGSFISALAVTGTGICSPVGGLTVVFTRPYSDATMNTDQAGCTGISYTAITITSPESVSAIIKVFASGRIQIN